MAASGRVVHKRDADAVLEKRGNTAARPRAAARLRAGVRHKTEIKMAHWAETPSGCYTLSDEGVPNFQIDDDAMAARFSWITPVVEPTTEFDG